MVKSSGFDPLDRLLWPNLSFAVRYNKEQHFANEYMTDYLNPNLRAIQTSQQAILYGDTRAPPRRYARKLDYDALTMIDTCAERSMGR